MKTNLIFTVFLGLFMSLSVHAQPSDATLRTKVQNYYENPINLTFGKADLEKRWVKDHYAYYWSKHFNCKLKTEYPGVYSLHYGGVQYLKSGNSYIYDNFLTGGFDGYEGIPTPSKESLNAHLKNTFDPLNFYAGYLLNYIVEAPNTIELAADPKFKWVNLNELRCNVTTTYTLKTNDIGNMEEQKGTFEIVLLRSADGISYDKEAKLLNSGKWLPVPKGFKKGTEPIKKFMLSKEEADAKKTLAQLNAVRAAEEFKKSLAVVEIPKFKSSNHLMQFTHELLLEGDEEKVKAFMYQMLPRGFFQEWSEIVLNQNGEMMMAEALEDLPNYSKAFCQHPEIKEIRANYVRFYDRAKKRMNGIYVKYENDRWYITDIRYTIRAEDFALYEQSGEDNCEGDLIFIDDEPLFNPGDPIKVLERGTWFDGEVVSADMSKGGYNVTYGRSNLSAWKFVNEVKAGEVKEEDKFKEFAIGEKVNAKYSGVWYKGTIKSVSYDTEQYLVDIPVRGTEAWLSSKDLEAIEGGKSEVTDEKEDTNESESSEEKKEKKKLNIKVPKIKIK
ncbi:MAG: hypothetical protein ABJG68_03045 [Crocinitomicaceae bacterium]